MADVHMKSILRLTSKAHLMFYSYLCLANKEVLQSLAQDKAIPNGASECGQVDDCRHTMQHAEGLVQLLHCLRVRAWIRVFLAVAGF